MPRPRSPNRDKALQLWLSSGKKRPLKNIAAELQVSEEQIRKWKNQDQWEKVTLPVVKGNVTNRNVGGQPGNKNAVGHGGTGPPGNKNAVKTGEFETLFFDTLDSKEIALVQSIQMDKERLLLQEIQLLTVREHRMLRRIESLRESAETEEDSKSRGMTAVKRKTSYDDDAVEYVGVLGQIQVIEDALTRVQARRQRAIEAIHRFGFDDARLELEAMKLELEISKADTDDTETPEDGFLEALNVEATEVWGEANE